MHEEARIASNQLKRKENALVLPNESFVGPEIDRVGLDHKSD
jgi:hypothetical protein